MRFWAALCCWVASRWLAAFGSISGKGKSRKHKQKKISSRYNSRVGRQWANRHPVLLPNKSPSNIPALLALRFSHNSKLLASSTGITHTLWCVCGMHNGAHYCGLLQGIVAAQFVSPFQRTTRRWRAQVVMGRCDYGSVSTGKARGSKSFTRQTLGARTWPERKRNVLLAGWQDVAWHRSDCSRRFQDKSCGT